MALNIETLTSDLYSAFMSMTDGDNAVFSEKVSKAVKDFVESGSITTIDTGAVTGGVFAGTGTGKVTCDYSICHNILFPACNQMRDMRENGNAYLAQQAALGIHSMVSAGVVNTDVNGIITPPSGPPIPTKGKAKGAIIGTPSPMQVSFFAAFNAMNSIYENGERYMAGKMAIAVNVYLVSAVVTTSGLASIAGSAGAGTMA